jgi:hypothetical protein
MKQYCEKAVLFFYFSFVKKIKKLYCGGRVYLVT